MPSNQIFGCDIDPDAFGHLAKLFECPVDLTRFRKVDFLEQDFPDSWIGSFDAVIGNPPYLPCRKIRPENRKSALQTLEQEGLKLDRRASLWAYFVALSIRFIATGGRMAWVLPSSFLYANYARELRMYISSMFENVRAFELQERQFLLEGTEEKTIILLADRKLSRSIRQKPEDISLTRCSGVRELSNNVLNWQNGEILSKSVCGNSVFDSLSKAPRELYLQLKFSKHHCRIGDHLKIQIGLVTGNNNFFLRTDEERREARLPVPSLVEVLPRFLFVNGLEFRQGDFGEMIIKGAKGYLISESNVAEAPNEIKAYLGTYLDSEKEKCSTFKKRAIWCQTNDGAIPDAFFPVMQHNGPRLVLNNASVNCTNSIHRGYFKTERTETEKKLLALASLSSFSQLSAEISGRFYGSGALKHEPREAENIGILLPPIHHRKITAAFQKADKFLRDNNFDEASQIADYLILGAMGFDDVPTQASVLRSGLMQVRNHRQR
jgi:adenine-specific DNA-methyltransferase